MRQDYAKPVSMLNEAGPTIEIKEQVTGLWRVDSSSQEDRRRIRIAESKQAASRPEIRVMNPFTMIPDALTKSRKSEGTNMLVRKLIIAYLVRAFGYPGDMHQWRDLTLNQIATAYGLHRTTISKHFNYVYDEWVYFLADIERAYPGINTRELTKFLERVYQQAKSRVPDHPMCQRDRHICVRGTDTYVSEGLTVMCQRERHYEKKTRL